MTLYDMYQLVPHFEELCDLFYEKWSYAMDQLLVPRMGFVKLGSYSFPLEDFLYDDPKYGKRIRPEMILIDDAHHGYSLQKMVSLFEDLFGTYVMRIYNFAPQWGRLRDAMLDHEIGEIEIGDWTDDATSDRELKDELELKAYDNYLVGLPNEVRRNHREEFVWVQKGDNITKCFDKAEFVLMQGWCARHGIFGSMKFKTDNSGLSEQDKHYCELTQSDRPVDNLYAHFLDITRGMNFQGFFIGIIEAMYRKEFGEIPATVKKFY